jgi:hypothetical protein
MSSNERSKVHLKWLLHDPVARLVSIEDALERGDTGTAFTLSRDLEPDLRAAISEHGAAA